MMKMDNDKNKNIEGDEGGTPSDNIVIEERHRFGFFEIVFLVSLNAIGDALEFFDLTGIGAVVGVIVDFIVGPTVTFYLFLKGTPRVLSRNAMAQGAELIPFLDILPIRTTIIILTILATNNPERWGKFMGLAKAVTVKK